MASDQHNEYDYIPIKIQDTIGINNPKLRQKTNHSKKE